MATRHTATTPLTLATLVALFFALGFLTRGITLHRADDADDQEPPAGQPPESLRRLEQLAAVPYLQGATNPGSSERGVVVHDRERVYAGVNFFNPRTRNAAHLVDMDGRELHSWRHQTGPGGWQHAELLPGGEVLVVVLNQRVLKLDAASRPLWEHRTEAHHDLWVTGDGDIYVLSRVRRQVPVIHPQAPVLVDVIDVLSADGAKKGEISVLMALLRSPYAFLLPSSSDLPYDPATMPSDFVLDVLHTNHVEVFDGSLEGLSPLFRRGNILVSMRTINTIAVIDPDTVRVVWAWGPSNLTRQHHPRLLANGHILLFDNGYRTSQVVELDPLRQQVAWRYAPREGFFSELRGSVQRMANGNTLITESDKGQVLEVTAAAEVVWKYVSPIVDADEVRSPIWRMTRFQREELPFLEADAGVGE